MAALFTISEVGDKVDGKLRQLKLMADAGAIQAVSVTQHPGRGVHRLFPESELPIAAILVALVPFRLPIATLQEVASVIRLLLKRRGAGWDDKLTSIIEDARNGTGDAYMTIYEAVGAEASKTRPFAIFVDSKPTIPLTPGAPRRRRAAIVIDLLAAWESLR